MTLSKFTKREIIRNLFISSAIFAFFLGYDLMSHNTKAAIIMAVLIAIEQAVVLVVWRCKTKEDEIAKKREWDIRRRQWNEAVEKAAEISPEDLPKYNGGLRHMTQRELILSPNTAVADGIDVGGGRVANIKRITDYGKGHNDD